MSPEPEPEPEPAPGTIVGKRYRLEERIGAGASGTVYRAVHEETGQAIAVKLVAAAASPDEAARRFEREAEAVGRLDHPGCVRILEMGRTDDGALFLAMEHVGGLSLAQVLGRTPRLPVARAVRIAAQILDVVGAGHELGVVHRDLKPENIMLVGPSDEETVKVLDFGIARLMAPPDVGGGSAAHPDTLSGAGAVVGTPEYLAPEQALGEAVDGRADIYSVGVILYEMLAGRRPLEGRTRNELLSAHLTRDVRPLREVAPESAVSPELEAIVMKALAKRRDDRWQSARELAEALHAAPLPGPSAEASPPPVPSDESHTAPMPIISDGVPEPIPQQNTTRRLSKPQKAVVPPRLLGSPFAIAGAVLLVAALIVWRVTARPAATSDDLGAARAALARGDLPTARAAAERLAHERPDDARVFALLGHVLFAQSDKERGLAAYREAVRMGRASVDGQMLANLRATFADPAHGEAAFKLAEDIGADALATVSELMATTRDTRLRRRAAEAAVHISLAAARTSPRSSP